LRSPQIGAVTGAIPRFKPAKVFNELFLTAVLAIVGAILCGLPFHLIAFVFSGLNESLGRIAAVHSPGSGYYVVAVVLVVRFLAMIPALRYKDQAMVTIAPSTAKNPPRNATHSAASQPGNIENNKVLSH
jgi:hypothetical protein